MSGILAIWNDCINGRENTYEEWYQDEHLPERMSLPGFRTGRRYEAVQAPRRFLTTYEVDRPEVLGSAEYRRRLDNPTVRTAEIMRDGFTNMSRTACERQDVRGAARGAYAVTIAVTDPREHPRLRDLAGRNPLADGPVHVEFWSAAADVEATSAESDLRGGDERISGCLELEFLRHRPALRAADHARRLCPGAEVGAYHLLCTLRKDGPE